MVSVYSSKTLTKTPPEVDGKTLLMKVLTLNFQLHWLPFQLLESAM